MDEITSFDQTKRQTINPLMDEMNRVTEPILKVAIKEFGYDIPLAFRLYNQIRFYEEYGKLRMGTSVASKEQLATQFGVTVKQIEMAYNNLTNKYKLGGWVEHDKPVFRNVKRTWMSSERLKNISSNYYSVIPELLQRNSSTITVEYLPSDKPPLSETKKKVSESNTLLRNGQKPVYGKPEINEVFELWEEIVGYPIKQKPVLNRRAAYNLTRSLGLARLTEAMRVVSASQRDRFAPSISDFVSLQAKIDDLRVWLKKQSTTTGKVYKIT